MKLMAFALALSGMASAAPVVEVCIVDRFQVPEPILHRATVDAAHVFESIGVHIEWRVGKPHPGAIVLKIVSAPARVPVAIRGETNLKDGSIAVYYDRIEPMLDSWPALVPTLLGQVFAHEIGHSLERAARHSDTGTLKAHWALADYREMLGGRLRFAPEDASLIRSRVMH